MAENTTLIREQKWLEPNVHLPQVDDNLHICALRGWNIPYDTLQRQLNRLSNTVKHKPGIPPRQSSLQKNHKIDTSYIQTKLYVSRKWCTHHLDKYCLQHWQQHLIEYIYHPDTLDKTDKW